MRLIPYIFISLFLACSGLNNSVLDSFAVNTDDASGTCIAYKVLHGYTYFITCSHVIEDSKNVRIDGEDAEVVKIFKEIDTAVLRIKKIESNILVLDRETPKTRTKVIGIGYPKGLGPIITTGFVASPSGDNTMWPCSAPTCPGCSGGPVVDVDTNKVIGMTRSIAQYGSMLIPHIHFFVPSYIICDYLSKEGLL